MRIQRVITANEAEIEFKLHLYGLKFCFKFGKWDDFTSFDQYWRRDVNCLQMVNCKIVGCLVVFVCPASSHHFNSSLEVESFA